jgi:WD40 repeat protein
MIKLEYLLSFFFCSFFPSFLFVRKMYLSGRPLPLSRCPFELTIVIITGAICPHTHTHTHTLVQYTPGDNSMWKWFPTLFIYNNSAVSMLLITSCATKREIKVWQCEISGDGKHEVVLFRSFKVDECIDFGIDLNTVDQQLQTWIECHSNFDGTKILLGVYVSYLLRFRQYNRAYISVIDIDTGRGTLFPRNHNEVTFIDGLCASTVDNKIAAILGQYVYIWDIDIGPDVTLHRFAVPESNQIPFLLSRSSFLDPPNNSLIRHLPEDIICYRLEDGSKHSCITLSKVRAITVSLSLQRIAVASGKSGTLISLFETQSWTQVISWGDDPPQVSLNRACHFLEFCPGSTDLLSYHPLIETINIWNSLTAERIWRFDGWVGIHNGSVRWCDVGKILVSNLYGNVKILDSASGEELCCWKAHDGCTAVCAVRTSLHILM